jgi:hypothetical protein
MDVGSFSPGQEALSKSPAATHGLAGRSPASAEEGGLSFGDFSLATQRKATRPPQEDETPLFESNNETLSGNTKNYLARSPYYLRGCNAMRTR